eukprot:jgi/Psemu1/69152/estExt_Genemark1.C_7270019
MESFLWTPKLNSSNGDDGWSWKIDYVKSSKIYDSDPQSLKKKSHTAWKKELHLTRFSNQELPEALWGSNFLSLTYRRKNISTTRSETNSEHSDCNDNAQKETVSTAAITKRGDNGIRISFCALEALRTWALMDMDLEAKDVDNDGTKNAIVVAQPHSSNQPLQIHGIDVRSRPTIIPHKSGRIPDAWDYTYTTNYSGSVERLGNPLDGSTETEAAARQPDQTTLYAIRTPERDEIVEATTASGPNTSVESLGPPVRRPATRPLSAPTVELRPPLCKCVGGRMICAGMAQGLNRNKRTATTERQQTQDQKVSTSSSTTISTPKTTTVAFASSRQSQPSVSLPPRPSPKWVPYTDGPPFDLEGLLNSQRSPPLHYTGTVPLWIQNLDPHSYSYLTVTALVCGRPEGGFLATVLRCFVRVNGVRVRLIDTKFLVQRQHQRRRCQNSDQWESKPATVILRERSWKEGTWEEYTAGMSNPQNHGALGTDLEQGTRASRKLPHKIPPVVDQMILWDDDYGDGLGPSPPFQHIGRDGNETKLEDPVFHASRSIGKMTTSATKVEWTHSLPPNQSITTVCPSSCKSSMPSRQILPIVVDDYTIVALDATTGEPIWECDLNSKAEGREVDEDTVTNASKNWGIGMRPSIMSLAIHHGGNPSPNNKIVAGDDRGCVHVLHCSPETENQGTAITQQSFSFPSGDSPSAAKKKNVQRTSSWVENVIWSDDGRHFAAAAGKQVMINGNVVEMAGTIYDFFFFPCDGMYSSGEPSAADPNGSAQLSHTEDVRTLPVGRNPHGYLAIAVYGGLTLVDVDSMEVWHRWLDIGSSAVLSVSIASDGLSIGVGSLDKRLRVFRCAINAKDSTGRDLLRQKWSACDWIGFDGGVSSVRFSPDHRLLAALGGSTLFIVQNSGSEWGEAPVVCSLWLPEYAGGKNAAAARFKSFAWVSECTLVASTADRRLHFFDVRATIDTVPKQCYPINSVPIEKDFRVSGNSAGTLNGQDEIIVWGRSSITQMKISLELDST